MNFERKKMQSCLSNKHGKAVVKFVLKIEINNQLLTFLFDSINYNAEITDCTRHCKTRRTNTSKDRIFKKKEATSPLYPSIY